MKRVPTTRRGRESGLGRKEFLGILVSPLAAAQTASKAHGEPAFVPRPKQWRRHEGECAITPPLSFSPSADAGIATDEVRLALGKSLSLIDASGSPGATKGLQLEIGDPRVGTPSPEAYRLAMTRDRITITAKSGDGLLAGLRTLSQLALEQPLPQCEITDWPDMSLRAAHLCYHLVRETTAYNCPNYDALLLQIDRLAAVKYNGVLLELESMFPYEKHPLVSCKIAFTREQMEQIRDRLRSHRMEIIPMVQCLGHAYNVLVHDEYAEYREVPDTIQQYCPTNRKVADLYMEFVDQYLEMFPGIRQWHMGGDESRRLGLCNPCKEKIEEQGISQLYVDHVNEIASRLHKRNLTPLLWSDMLEHHPEAVPDLPNYVKIVYWNYDFPKWPRKYAAPLFRENGFSVVGAPAVRWGQAGTELSVYYPEALRGIETLIPRLTQDDCTEAIVTNWMKGSPHEPTHYGFAYAADLCWSTNRTRQDFQQRYAALNFGVEDGSLCDVYETLSVKVPYAEPVQLHMPDRLDRFDLSGLRFPKKWRGYNSPEQKPHVLRQLRHAWKAALEAEQTLGRFHSRVSRDRRQFDLLLLSAECIRVKARFGLALHAGHDLDVNSADDAAIFRWLRTVPGILADWQAAKKKHRDLLLVSGFVPCINFLSDLMFEPMEYDVLDAIRRRLAQRIQKL